MAVDGSGPGCLVLGIDPASVRLAFYAVHPLLPVTKAKKVTLGKKYSPQVAYEAWNFTLDILDEVATMAGGKQKVAFVEAPVVGRGGVRSTLVQAFTSGVVQACLVQAGFTTHLVNQSQWKTWLTGRATSGKDLVKSAMKGRFPKDYQIAQGDGDVLDAAALARYGCETVRRGALVASVRGMSNR